MNYFDTFIPAHRLPSKAHLQQKLHPNHGETVLKSSSSSSHLISAIPNPKEYFCCKAVDFSEDVPFSCSGKELLPEFSRLTMSGVAHLTAWHRNDRFEALKSLT